jgi:hypothetical protein
MNMKAEFRVEKSGLSGNEWKTVCSGSEAKAREVFARQLRLHSVGRFRLVDAEGRVVEERKATPLFSDN